MTLRRNLNRGIVYLLLIALAAYFLMTIYILAVTSFKSYAEVDVTRMWQLPRSPSFLSVLDAWSRVAPNFWNSALIPLPAALISSAIGSVNGYVFAKWKFPRSNLIFMLILFGIWIRMPRREAM